MSTKGNKRGKGKAPGTKQRRFQEIADAINRLKSEADAMVIEGANGPDAVSVHVGGNTSAYFKGHAGTWRAKGL